MPNCPCCGYRLVHCFHHHHTLSFCRHCWQEMPDLTLREAYSMLKHQSLKRMIQHSVTQPPTLKRFLLESEMK